MRFVLLNRTIFLFTMVSTMEQHPVPQNVTTFQFRLIGDMTIKQFGYLAGGIILGYIFYKLPLPFFFTWPLAIGSGVLGFGLAFVPVEERPMDIWIASFFKNVYSPTQYVWSREARSGSAGQKKPPAPTKEAKQAVKRMAVVTQPQQQAPAVPSGPTSPTATPQAVLSLARASDPFSWIKKIFHTNPKVELSPGLTFNNALAAHQDPPKTPPKAHPPISVPPTALATPPIAPTATRPPAVQEHVVLLQGQLSDALAERERLEKELVALHQKMEHQTQASAASQQPMRHATTTPAPSTQTSVRVFTPEAATKAGLPRLTTFPNIVTGIIKDYNDNLLPGILITVRDATDTPLRALKTNKLGQFAASTPLPNGTYIVEIEDPKNALVFDKVQITLNGAVSPPIEVVSKSQKRVERDRLAREIFGNQPM